MCVMQSYVPMGAVSAQQLAYVEEWVDPTLRLQTDLSHPYYRSRNTAPWSYMLNKVRAGLSLHACRAVAVCIVPAYAHRLCVQLLTLGLSEMEEDRARGRALRLCEHPDQVNQDARLHWLLMSVLS